ncbi:MULTISPECIES: ImpA family type VI secretion system protein [unclassified Paraburkholderia]|uniref:type VI secretion system protein TssA n=1 Tax=unclassified Paraburkholderia TaxID=2615204 RepID=UPI00160F40AE|nr:MULTISPECIES: type VI secretion system ImpA family N-terminal domain-containing protein [unclassified Paraburkholderia]
MTQHQLVSEYFPDSLDFDEDFIKIDAAICEYDAVGLVPQRKGESAFQWASVETACAALLEKAKDVRVAIWYLRACIARRGLAGLADGVRLLADLMRAPVDELHPRALAGESHGQALLIHLGWIAGPQFLHQLGSARLANREETLNDLVSGRTASSAEDRDDAKTMALVQDIHESLSDVMKSAVAIGQDLDVSRALDLLDVAASRLAQTGAPAANPAHESIAQPRADAPQPEPACPGGALKTRREVGAALERIVEYFRVHEPSHPAPIFLSRIQRMLGSGFEEVMAELYPEAASLVAQLNRPQSSIK